MINHGHPKFDLFLINRITKSNHPEILCKIRLSQKYYKINKGKPYPEHAFNKVESNFIKKEAPT